jgi:hypothetical protein
MPYYQLGNCLRGYAFGDFEADEEAWRVLSARFNDSFPSRYGRSVHLMKVVREGETAGGNETEADRNLREALEEAHTLRAPFDRDFWRG